MSFKNTLIQKDLQSTMHQIYFFCNGFQLLVPVHDQKFCFIILVKTAIKTYLKKQISILQRLKLHTHSILQTLL